MEHVALFNDKYQEQKIELMGIKITNWSYNETIEKIENSINLNEKLFIAGVNSDILVQAMVNEELKDITNSASINNIDGMSVVWALRFLGYDVPERVACPELFTGLLGASNKMNWGVFLLGARKDVVSQAALNIEKKYPGISAVSFHDGYFSQQDEDNIVKNINSSGAKLLFLGMPSPKKEEFVKRNINQLNVNLVLGVGGMFDIYAGVTKRAPIWMQKYGMEWFYRIIQEPRRMFIRYAKCNPIFAFLVLKYKIKMLFR